MRIEMPDSKVLKWLMGWMAAASLLKLVHAAQPHDQTAQQVVGNYLAGLVLIYALGAFWSEFPVVYVSAMITGAVFIAAVVTRGPQSKTIAKAAFVMLMYLSLFCIWVEPWLTSAGVVTFVLMAFLQMSMTVVDIGVSVGWLVLWAATTDAINRKC